MNAPETGLRLAGPQDATRALGALLERSADGDETAFLEFYDATVREAFALELLRSRARRAGTAATHAEVEHTLRRRYVTAWRLAADYPASGLSPVCWLLSLDVATHDGAPRRGNRGEYPERSEASCA